MMKRFLTLKEAAGYLGIAENELDSLSKAHQITAYKIGGIYTRFKVDDLEAYRRKGVTRGSKNYNSNFDNIRDFFYFNDFYIYSCFAIAVMLYFILKKP
jgi:excisionase family DNA binding protein